MYLVTIKRSGSFNRAVHGFWYEEMNAKEAMRAISSQQEPQLWQRVKGTCENCEYGEGKYRVVVDPDLNDENQVTSRKNLCKDCREKVINAMKGENNDYKASS